MNVSHEIFCREEFWVDELFGSIEDAWAAEAKKAFKIQDADLGVGRNLRNLDRLVHFEDVGLTSPACFQRRDFVLRATNAIWRFKFSTWYCSPN